MLRLTLTTRLFTLILISLSFNACKTIEYQFDQLDYQLTAKSLTSSSSIPETTQVLFTTKTHPETKQQSFLLSTASDGQQAIHLTQKYFEEYIYFINRYLKGSSLQYPEQNILGVAHSDYGNTRIGFAKDKKGNLLISECKLGYCDDRLKSGIYLTKTSAKELKYILQDYDNNNPVIIDYFKNKKLTNKKNALVYFYKKQSPGQDMEVFVSGKSQGTLTTDSYIVKEVRGGSREVRFQSSTKSFKKEIKFKPGTVTYIKFTDRNKDGLSAISKASHKALNHQYDYASIKQEYGIIARNDLLECDEVK